jgi:AcrR family transcriptional regulator
MTIRLGRRLARISGRRSNVQRTAEMRTRLERATIEVLVKRGYNALTTKEVAVRADVSRGAFQHHFRTKEELVLAAVEHLFDDRNAEFRAAFTKIPPDADRPAVALDMLWKILGSDSFYAWLELAVAGRTDERLGQKVRELGARTAAAVEQTFREFFPTPKTPNPFYELAPRFAFALLQGLALDRLLVTQQRLKPEEIITLIKRLSPFAIPPGGQP